MASQKTIVRAVRLNLLLDKYITIIAEYEDRNLSNTIQRLLHKAVQDYFMTHNDDFEFEGFVRNKIPLEDLYQYIPQWQRDSGRGFKKIDDDKPNNDIPF